MGLDNGISLKLKKPTEAVEKKLEEMEFDHYDGDYYELLYWRKCWGVRKVILDILEDHGYEVNDDTYRWELDIDTLKAIVARLTKCYNQEWWDNNGDSIWDFIEVDVDDDGREVIDDVFCSHMWYDLCQAYYFLGWLENAPEEYKNNIIIEFYDSY